MIVNLYVDHMLATPPASAEEVWNATGEHAKLYAAAAHRIGVTPSELREFRNSLLDGKATYMKLPRRFDAMAGNRRGRVYAVRNAVLTTPAMGWRVRLADGNLIYVPQTCGNLSVVHPPVVAYAPPPKHHKLRYTPAMAIVPRPETPVALVPPPVTPDVVAPVAIVPAAPAAAASHPSGLLYLLPAIGGLFATVGHGGGSQPPTAPPCTGGSNAGGVCSNR